MCQSFVLKTQVDLKLSKKHSFKGGKCIPSTERIFSVSPEPEQLEG